MSKSIVYEHAIAYDTDLLTAQREAEITVGGALQAILGDNGRGAIGLSCGPNSPAGMSVVLQPGGLTAKVAIDSSDYGSLTAEPALIHKLGWNKNTTIHTLDVTGLTAGQSKFYTLAGKFVEEDTDYEPQEYYNSATPNDPDEGAPLPSLRQTKTLIQLVPGTPAATGSAVVPAVPSGYTGLWNIEVRFGDTSITGPRITKHADFPAIVIGGGGNSTIKVFENSGTFPVPTSITSVRVVVVGAGGGGGGAYLQGSSGGGGGGQLIEAIVPVASGSSVTVTVGSGGAGGPNTNGSGVGTQAPGNSGGNGGSSSFGTFVTATGGQGGPGAGNDIATPGGKGANSGSVANTVTNYRIQNGSNGDIGFIPSGLDGGRGGKGGESGMGGGAGAGGIGVYWANSGLSTDGTGYGGGGGGGGSGNLGAKGANGVVIVYY